MMEPWENGKNPTLISNPIWGPQDFLQGFYQYNVPSYHPVQFPGKLMNQTWNFGPDFDLFSSNLGSPFFQWNLPLLVNRHCLFQVIILCNWKLMHQPWENAKKINFEPNFGLFDQNLGPKNFGSASTSRHCSKL